jgi:hypothetical protein
MTEWTKKSVELATATSYLDDIAGVYPVSFEFADRKLEYSENALKKVYDSKDPVKLIQALLRYDKFPINNYMVPFFRKNPSAIAKNPKTANKIANYIYTIGFPKLVRKLKKAPEPSKRMGGMFKAWIKSGALGRKFVRTADDFLADNSDKILVGTDATLKKFASDYLGYTGKRGLDVIAMVGGNIIVGEAKYIGDFGGSQNNQEFIALNLCHNKFSGNITGRKIIPVAILDGVCYIKDTKSNKNIFHSNKYIMSSLVLKDFFDYLDTQPKTKPNTKKTVVSKKN